MNGRTAILGGAGYIGSHLLKRLLRHKQEPVVYDNLSRGHRELVTGGIFIEGDIADTEKLAYVFREYQVATVMHFAAFSNVGESVEQPASYYENNVVKTFHLLETVLKFRIPSFIFSSTCAIYGEPEKLPLDETHPCLPISPYGNTKLAVEKMLADYSRMAGFNYVSLRYFNASGADPEGQIGEWHEPETHLIPLVLQTALGLRPVITIWGEDYPTPDGSCIRDYIHVNDLAEAHLLAAGFLADQQASAVFNLGNGTGYSVKEVIAAAQKISGRAIPVAIGPRRAGDSPILVGSSAKIQQMLGWQPQYRDLESMLATAWAWHRKSPSGLPATPGAWDN